MLMQSVLNGHDRSCDFERVWDSHCRLRLRSDIHCQYWKSTVHVTCTINFQYWQWISERNL